jgi:hypothetical protein
MNFHRKTAIVQIELFSGATEGSLPLATEREFGVMLLVEGQSYPAQNFCSPINDEQWRDFIRRLRDCNVNHDDTGYRGAAAIRSLAHQLYQALVGLNPVLREFMGRAGVPRRLVIQTTRPELHLLPWAGMVDDAGQFLAAGDLSVVQAWSPFNEMPVTTSNTLQLMTVLGDDTNQVTAGSLTGHPPEIQVVDGTSAFLSNAKVSGVDILHLEEHGSAILSEVGQVRSTALANVFSDVKLALLWSCYSGAANSWGESPALCLHQNGAGLVLSFLAELHNLDAKSISGAFYRDVFGPAASRDPESALVRIRCAKFTNEFQYANWASMTVYLRCPLDLSALPLNGPRVPAVAWSAEVDPDAAPVPLTGVWAQLAATVSDFQPGTLNEFQGFADPAAEAISVLPRLAFRAWRGNVIRLDGSVQPLPEDILGELSISVEDSRKLNVPERLVWFFDQIARYGSPLIVWTNAAPRHFDFLKTVAPSSGLTFLLIYGPQPIPTVAELVDQNMLEEARQACATLPADCDDDQLSAAYYAFVRREDAEQSTAYMRRLANPAEMMLLIGNFISRRGSIPNPRQDWMLQHPDGRLSNLQQQHIQEDCYRKVMNDPGTEAPLRESGRAKHELGYLLQKRGKLSVAEMLYGQALVDLDGCPEAHRDIRWRAALGNLLRDWADLLAKTPDRLDRASELLRRAMAINSFYGRRLQLAYALSTAAEIALTGRRYSEAIENAVETANLFEEFKNWRGWGEAVVILFDCLAETRETARMLSLADLAVEKLRTSNLPEAQRDRLSMAFIFEKAKAYWIAGALQEARLELEKLGCGAAPKDCKIDLDPDFEMEVKRLWKFLAIGSPQ